MIFDNDKKTFNTTTSLYFTVIQYSFTTLELSAKEGESTRKFREYLFLKGVVIKYEKATPRSIYFLENFDGGVNISL